MQAQCKVYNQSCQVLYLITVALGFILLTTTTRVSAGQLPTRVVLNVPYLYQILPGSSGATTKTCGQADAAMIAGYFANQCPSPQVIVNEDKWLANRYGMSEYLSPDGYYTNFLPPRNALGALLSLYWGLNYAVTSGTFPGIEQQLALGHPVIAGVKINGGVLSTSGVAHWIVVVGYDLGLGLVYVNDSGTIYGNHKAYSLTQFAQTWATQGYTMAAVWR
jgi:hypothetical protein